MSRERTTGAPDPDGVLRVVTPRSGGRGRVFLVVAAALLLGLGGLEAWRSLPRTHAPAVSAPAARPRRAPTAMARATAPDPRLAQGPKLPGVPPSLLQPGQELYVNQIDSKGDRTGIFAFNPPGTKPIKGGLLVPDGFVLPPGYVRHYQTTDDGEQVGPILMFSPDSHPVGPDGKPIELPADLIVPPELAPPNMPLQALDPPPVRRDWDETNQIQPR